MNRPYPTQAERRLSLTATLVREHGKEDEVLALIGPKRILLVTWSRPGAEGEAGPAKETL